MKVIGVDPGHNTGIVLVEIGRPEDTSTWKFLESTVIRPSESKKLTSAAEVDRHMLEQIDRWVTQWSISPFDLAVLEEPLDGQTSWRGYSKQRKGTAFRLGAYYALAISGIARHVERMVSYPPTTVKNQKRIGWMQGTNRYPDRDAALGMAASLLRSLKVKVDDLSEHELCAFGVLCYHMTQHISTPGSERLAAARRKADLQSETGAARLEAARRAAFGPRNNGA